MPDRTDIIVGEGGGCEGGGDSPAQARRWLGVYFDCCGVYARLYRSRDGREYAGACPRCRRMLRIAVGADGTVQRFFRAS